MTKVASRRKSLLGLIFLEATSMTIMMGTMAAVKHGAGAVAGSLCPYQQVGGRES